MDNDTKINCIKQMNCYIDFKNFWNLLFSKYSHFRIHKSLFNLIKPINNVTILALYVRKKISFFEFLKCTLI